MPPLTIAKVKIHTRQVVSHIGLRVTISEYSANFRLFHEVIGKTTNENLVSVQAIVIVETHAQHADAQGPLAAGDLDPAYNVDFLAHF